MKNVIDKDSYTIADISELTGLRGESINYFVSDGIISAKAEGDDWNFSKADLDDLLDNPYVLAAIKLKEDAKTEELMVDKDMKTASISLCIDHNFSDEAREILSQKLSENHKKNKAVTVKYERISDNVRIILNGPQESVKSIYMSL